MLLSETVRHGSARYVINRVRARSYTIKIDIWNWEQLRATYSPQNATLWSYRQYRSHAYNGNKYSRYLPSNISPLPKLSPTRHIFLLYDCCNSPYSFHTLYSLFASPTLFQRTGGEIQSSVLWYPCRAQPMDDMVLHVQLFWPELHHLGVCPQRSCLWYPAWSMAQRYQAIRTGLGNCLLDPRKILVDASNFSRCRVMEPVCWSWRYALDICWWMIVEANLFNKGRNFKYQDSGDLCCWVN